jgi:hypothetical protein
MHPNEEEKKILTLMPDVLKTCGRFGWILIIVDFIVIFETYFFCI